MQGCITHHSSFVAAIVASLRGRTTAERPAEAGLSSFRALASRECGVAGLYVGRARGAVGALGATTLCSLRRGRWGDVAGSDVSAGERSIPVVEDECFASAWAVDDVDHGAEGDVQSTFAGREIVFGFSIGPGLASAVP